MKILLLVLYGISALGMIVSLYLTFFDLKKYVKGLKASGVKFMKLSKFSLFANWVKLLFCIFCPLVNTLLLIAMLIAEDSVAAGAKRGINDRIINEEE